MDEKLINGFAFLRDSSWKDKPTMFAGHKRVRIYAVTVVPEEFNASEQCYHVSVLPTHTDTLLLNLDNAQDATGTGLLTFSQIADMDGLWIPGMRDAKEQS